MTKYAFTYFNIFQKTLGLLQRILNSNQIFKHDLIQRQSFKSSLYMKSFKSVLFFYFIYSQYLHQLSISGQVSVSLSKDFYSALKFQLAFCYRCLNNSKSLSKFKVSSAKIYIHILSHYYDKVRDYLQAGRQELSHVLQATMVCIGPVCPLQTGSPTGFLSKLNTQHATFRAQHP